MSVIRMVGMLLIFTGASAIGFGAAFRVRQTAVQLQQLYDALEMMQCELNYTLTPLPALCGVVAKTGKGVIGTLFANLGAALSGEQPQNPAQAMRQAIAQTTRLSLPEEILFSLLELGDTLGKFDLEGQISMLRLTQRRIRTCLDTCERERTHRCRSYAALGICTGAALIILMI